MESYSVTIKLCRFSSYALLQNKVSNLPATRFWFESCGHIFNYIGIFIMKITQKPRLLYVRTHARTHAHIYECISYGEFYTCGS